MARDGSGNFALPLPPVEPDTVISSTWANQTLDDIAMGLSESLPVSGERGMTGPFRLADGSPSNPSFSFNSETATGLFRPSTNVVGFSVGGGERMRLSGGHLLIGRTVDDGTNILQVGGQAKIYGGFVVDGNLNVSTGATISGDTSLQAVGFTNATGNSIVLDTRLDVFGYGITTNGIFVSGNQTITGNLTVGTNVIAAGVAAVDSSFTHTISDTLQVNGSSALSTVNVSGNLTVVGTSTLPTATITSLNATGISTTNFDQNTATGAGELNLGVGRTADGGNVINFRTAAGNTTYNARVNRASGANGIFYFQQSGSGRFQFENDTSPDFRWTTAATGGLTHKFVAQNLTQGADYSVHGQSLSSVGNVNFFFQNSAQTTTQNYYSITRNATAGIGSHIFRTGGDAATTGSATTALTISETSIVPNLQVQNIVGSEASPSISFLGDNNTGIYRSAADNLDFATGGVRRLQIDSSGRLYSYSTGGELLTMKTTGNSGLLNLDVSSGTANINNLSWYLTSSGSAMLILRNDAKSGYVAPIQITRNASSGTAAILLKVGGDSNTTGSDNTAATITQSTGSTQGKLLVGHTSPDVFLNNADAASTDNFQILSHKTGATGPASMLGSDGSNNSIVGFSRTNTSSKRIVHSQIAGTSVSSTAGAERGRLDFGTKAAADAGVVSRLTIDETAATFSVPVISTLPVKTSTGISNGQITSVSTGFTINTSDIVSGGVYRIYNNSASSITITQGAGVSLRISGGTTGSRTIPANGIVIGTAVSATEIVFVGSMT